MSVDEKIILNKNQKHSLEIVIDRLILKSESFDRLTESVELALKISGGLLVVNVLPDKEYIFSEHFACPDCEISMEQLCSKNVFI